MTAATKQLLGRDAQGDRKGAGLPGVQRPQRLSGLFSGSVQWLSGLGWGSRREKGGSLAYVQPA